MIIRHPDTNKYHLNFDSYIIEVIRESEHMARFDLEVPDFIQIITFCRDKIFSSYETVKQLVKENDTLRYTRFNLSGTNIASITGSFLLLHYKKNIGTIFLSHFSDERYHYCS